MGILTSFLYHIFSDKLNPCPSLVKVQRLHCLPDYSDADVGAAAGSAHSNAFTRQLAETLDYALRKLSITCIHKVTTSMT